MMEVRQDGNGIWETYRKQNEARLKKLEDAIELLSNGIHELDCRTRNGRPEEYEPDWIGLPATK